MNWKDYITPVTFGILFFLVVIVFRENISGFLQNNTLGSEIFTFSSLLFGLILTCYAMIFGVIPSARKDFKSSETVKDINTYFKFCLITLLISIVASLVYLIIYPYWLFVINIVLVGLDLGFFAYIIFLINDIFELVNSN